MEFLERTNRRFGRVNTDTLFRNEQVMVAQMLGKSLAELKKDESVIKIKHNGIEVHNPKGIKQAFSIEKIPDAVKQTLLTASGTQPFMLNEAAAEYFGGATGVFSPSAYGEILEGVSMISTIPKLWGLQPFKPGELSGDLIYFAKSNPYGDGDPIDSGTPVFARTAEGRAGQDMSFEVKKEHFDAQRYICHFPYSLELQKILEGRLGLNEKIMEHFVEAGIYAEEYWAYHKWYLALTTGQLEGTNNDLYRDGVIADIDGVPEVYTAYYNLNDGCIKCGDSTAYGSATTKTASGADVLDLMAFVIEVMTGIKPHSTLTARSFRWKWLPQYAVVSRSVASKMWSDFKDGTLTTVWVSKNDIPLYKAEEAYLCRVNVGNIMLDVWVLPDEVMTQLATANASTYVTTDSPTYNITPMFFGRYFGMAAIAPATPRLFYVDDGFEVVSRAIGGVNVSQLRRNQTKVHTMYQLRSEIPLNMSMSFVVKVLDFEA